MKSGLDSLIEDPEEITILNKKFIDSGIYSAKQIHQPDNISQVYFENESLCKLLV